MDSFKTGLKKLIPDFLIRFITGISYGWHGNFSSWDDAGKQCSGYDSQHILDRVRSSALKVKEGKAVFERDSMIFCEIQYTFPLLSALMWIAAGNESKLNVLDFGGSLGSSYYQNKAFLDSLKDVNWCIVEQSEFVRTGKESFANDRLHFFYSIKECLKSFKINVIMLSSVIQYIEKPYNLIDQIVSEGIDFIIVDRTPFIKGKDRITIQKVNPHIYRATYPCWFFNKEKFIDYFKRSYKLLLEFDALDKANIPSEFKGFLFQRIT